MRRLAVIRPMRPWPDASLVWIIFMICGTKLAAESVAGAAPMTLVINLSSTVRSPGARSGMRANPRSRCTRSPMPRRAVGFPHPPKLTEGRFASG